MYDESFFDGWALLNRGVPDPNSALIDIPLDYGEWLKKLHGDEPRSNNPDTH
ncbi:MAG: hypothetical protein JF564_04685 [Sphingomonas sp.]|nr:hypothetical protein [Sphingomonas sp.]